MEIRGRIVYYWRRIRRRWWRMKRQTKIKILLVVIALLAGSCIGYCAGWHYGKGKEVQKYEKLLNQKDKEKQNEIEKLEKQNQKLQTELDNQMQKTDLTELPWYLTLVNEEYSMKKDYVPELQTINDGYQVDKRIAKSLISMLDAAEEDGMNIVICSAYRSVDRQTQVFNDSMKDRLNQGMTYLEAYEDTALSVAIPGTSEHGLGLAVDLVSSQYTELDAKQASTKEAKWLKENCYKYGFILRYPPEKTQETGIIYEPWHYRYVGVEDATNIMKQGVTLETYLEDYKS